MKYADEELLLDSSDVEYTFNTEEGKISAQLHTTLYIQFLNRGNNDKTIHFYWENRFILQQYRAVRKLYPEESEGYEFIDLKNLSRAVSNAHVWEKGEKFFCSLWHSLFSIMTYFPYISTFNSSFSPLNCTDLSIKSLRERLLGIVHIHCKIKIMGKKITECIFLT